MAFPQCASHFLTDNNSAQCGRDYRVTLEVSQFVREPGTHIRCDPSVLQEQSALKKLPAMQPRSQDKMTVEKCAGLAKKRKQIIAHAVVGCSYPEVSLTVLPPRASLSPAKAIASISTRAFFGRVETPTVERAGGWSAK